MSGRTTAMTSVMKTPAAQAPATRANPATTATPTATATPSAPTPLYAIYQGEWGFSPITTTIVFGIYAIAVLSSLLVFGKLSDHVGRRPVLLTALVVQVGAMV